MTELWHCYDSPHADNDFFSAIARTIRCDAQTGARQQIKKTNAHLTGAVVPSSDERWNHFKRQTLRHSHWIHRPPVDGFSIGRS